MWRVLTKMFSWIIPKETKSLLDDQNPTTNIRPAWVLRATARLKSVYVVRHFSMIRIFCKTKLLTIGHPPNSMKELNFYFDFLSPFSYFAWINLQRYPELTIHYKPVALGPLLNHWGIKGPGEVEPKREFLLKQCLRYAASNKIEFTTPKTHPFNSLYALRLALKSSAGELQSEVIKTLWQAGWQ